MGNYTGDPDTLTTPTSVTIADATNETPIVIESSAPHAFNTGDRVSISGVGGNTAANTDENAPWTITVLDDTHFALDTSVGNGAYTSGGSAVDHSLTPTMAEPVDGENEDAASVKVMLEGLADRSQFLALLRGKYRLVNQYVKQVSDDTWGNWSTNGSLNTAAWVNLTTASALFTFTNPAPTCEQNDVFEITVATTAVPTAVDNTTAPAIGIGVELAGGSNGIITGSAQKLSFHGDNTPICLRGLYVVPSGSKQTFNFGLMGYGNIASPPALDLKGHRTIIVNHWRPQP